VRCTKGAICDVIVDIRPESRTFKNWLRIELSEENHRSLFVPTGFAHGFQTLRNNCEIYYEMSAFHHPECARGIRWNDPSFGIVWPMEKMIISLRDQEYADFEI
jgi:dTDP-4-dehydrorhamnose 3,5-epimerase